MTVTPPSIFEFVIANQDDSLFTKGPFVEVKTLEDWSLPLRQIQRLIIHFFYHPSLFTICTSTFSKLVEGR
jgi:hypothetical protein